MCRSMGNFEQSETKIFMVVSSFPLLHHHTLKSVSFRHWLESLFILPLLFRSVHHFSIQMLLFPSHTVLEHSTSFSSFVFSLQNCVCYSCCSSPMDKPHQFPPSYIGSWDSITSASSSLMALLVLFTGFDSCVTLQRHLNSNIWVS